MTADKLNKAIADVVNAFMELDLIRGVGRRVGVTADGTRWTRSSTISFAQTSIRYGGTGGIGYYYISGTYIALFSRFIPVGVCEAVARLQMPVEVGRVPVSHPGATGSARTGRGSRPPANAWSSSCPS